jgi:hypothetical protein
LASNKSLAIGGKRKGAKKHSRQKRFCLQNPILRVQTKDVDYNPWQRK